MLVDLWSWRGNDARTRPHRLATTSAGSSSRPNIRNSRWIAGLGDRFNPSAPPSTRGAAGTQACLRLGSPRKPVALRRHSSLGGGIGSKVQARRRPENRRRGGPETVSPCKGSDRSGPCSCSRPRTRIRNSRAFNVSGSALASVVFRRQQPPALPVLRQGLVNPKPLIVGVIPP